MKLSEQLKNVLDLCDNSVDLVFEYNECTYVIKLSGYCYIIDNNNSLEDYMGKMKFDNLGVAKFDISRIHILNIDDRYKTLLYQHLCLITDTKLIVQILVDWFNYKLDDYMQVVDYDITMCTNLIKYVAHKLNEINNSNTIITHADNFIALDYMDKEQFMKFCNNTVQYLSKDTLFESRGYKSLQKILDSINYSDLFINAIYKLDKSIYVIFENVYKSIVYDEESGSYRKMTKEDITTLEKEYKRIETVDVPEHRISAIGTVLYNSDWETKRELEGHLLVYLLDLDKYFAVIDYDTDDMLNIVETFFYFTHHKDNCLDLNIVERVSTINEYKPAKKLQYFKTVEAEAGYLIGFSEGYVVGCIEEN